MVTSTTISIKYKAKTMHKTCFDSQGMILNVFYKKHFSKNVNSTRDPPPPPFTAKAIKNFHIFLNPSLMKLDLG